MFIPGLCSISFRDKTVDSIIDECIKNDIKCIEWGGDIHVPSGDIETATEIHRKTLNAGIKIYSYGSYYKIGENMDFLPVLETAKSLGSKIIRVWAGTKGPDETDKEKYDEIVEDARKISKLAKEEGIKVALECHIRTLTEKVTSTIKFLNDVDSDNLFMYFQPNQFLSFDENIDLLNRIKENVLAVHVFNWNKTERLPLKEGIDVWKEYLKLLNKKKEDLPLFLEFIHDDTYDGFKADSMALKEIIS